MLAVAEVEFSSIRNEDNETLFKSITVQNLLSFGPEAEPLPLENLNVLIGPNGSGKSNLLEAIALLRGAPHKNPPLSMRSVIAQGGGIGEWIWKGFPGKPASLECLLKNSQGQEALRHSITFHREFHSFALVDERIENERPFGDHPEPYLYYDYQGGHPVINVYEGDQRKLKPETVDPQLSILAQRQDPDSFPELAYLTNSYDQIRLYREWEFGRNTIFRVPQKTDLRTDRLEEDFSNLGLFLNRLRRDAKAKSTILACLRDLYEGLTDFDVIIDGGTVQVYFSEGAFSVPATRLSDGSMRYLCLLAILCDSEPPPFIGIEEPELGLHPDILPKLADLLVAASQRTQIVVTTHSDVLVDALTDRPSAVVVCEKHEGMTTMRRLDKEELAPWLEKYRLGELWTRGDIGGTRW